MSELRRLPGPVAERWDWQLQAACRDSGVESFFHPDNERGAPREAREAAAKAVCARCPVVAACLAHALAVREPYGVWGGLGEAEREALLAGRPDAEEYAAAS
jgi:WhiB family redox-sensing transcriptional regulator